jgi:ankyrin repeat protein
VNLVLIYQLLQEMARDDTEGNRPLHLVGNFEWFPHSCADVAAYLIAQGEDPNGRNLDGQTPLQALAERALLASDALDCDLQEREDLAEALLSAGADPWAGAAVGITAGDAFPGLVGRSVRVAAVRFH